jgi:hypothetical protein
MTMQIDSSWTDRHSRKEEQMGVTLASNRFALISLELHILGQSVHVMFISIFTQTRMPDRNDQQSTRSVSVIAV